MRLQNKRDDFGSVAFWAPVSYPPCEREPGEDLHDPPAEVSFVPVVLERRVERVAEHVLYLVPVHDTHPLAPQIGAGPLQQQYRNMINLNLRLKIFYRPPFSR